MSTNQTAAAAAVHQLHAAFEPIRQAVEAHARHVFRHVFDPGRRDDAIQNAQALAWLWFRRKAARGSILADCGAAVARYAVRATRAGRRLGAGESVREPMDGRCQRTNRLRRLRMDADGRVGILRREAPSGRAALAVNPAASIPDSVHYRLEYPRWFARLTHRQRSVALDLALGYSTQEAAFLSFISPGRVSQLRRLFWLDWQLIDA